MSKEVRNQLLQAIEIIEKGTQKVRELISDCRMEECIGLLTDCQDLAIAVGTRIEDVQGIGTKTVKSLEEYCECLFRVNECMQTSEQKSAVVNLERQLECVKSEFENEFPNKKEIVFLPYKASMWDSLESVWKAADADPECDAYVVPIPYFDRNPDFSLGKFHYEGASFPDYVPITDYREYDLGSHKPDIVYIHNPYDEGNYVTSVHPKFYSAEVKKNTNCLVYVPYFVAGYYANQESAGRSIPLCIYNVDVCILQSEVQKRILSVNQELTKKMVVLGSPKIDRIVSPIKQPLSLIDMKRMNGKKIILVNTSISRILNDRQWFKKMDSLIQLFNQRTDIFMLWRPHPLLFTTIDAMRPEQKNEMNSIIRRIDELDNSYIDRTASADAAIAISDGLISDYSSLVLQYTATGKPILLTVGSSDYRKTKLVCGDYFSNYFINDGVSIEDFITIILTGNDYKKEERMKYFRNSIVNTNGTCGQKIHAYIKRLWEENGI